MDKKLGLLITLFFLFFSIFVTYVLFNQQIRIFTRASEELQPSAEKSLIFAWPLSAKSDGQEKVTINVFVRNEKDRSVENRTVSLITNLGKVEPQIQTSDKSGKATFVLTSNQKGTANIQAVVDNQIYLRKTISIKFD
ncbi:MAG: Ig-like domain-containing protein [Patescibacteria group bacterium]|nr:Ig-like domain-containing protein [Patescibacteria group bacterium]